MMNNIDWNKVLQVLANYAITFAAGWGFGVLARLSDREAIAYGFITLASNAIGLHQEKPQMLDGKIEVPK